MKTKIYCLLLLLYFIHVFQKPPAAEALAKFSTNYQVNYTVYRSGTTHVKFFVNQVNNLSVVYATEFSLNVNHTKISNIRVSDEGTSLKPDVIKTHNGSVISFPFINKVVGKDKKHFFTIEYDTEDVTAKIGNTWEINIPKIEPDENTVDSNIVLTLPDNFPKPAFIDPHPSTVINNNYYFSGKTLGNKHISAVFGQEQYYRIKLNYHIQNDTNTKAVQKISIPPDTNYQKVLINSIDTKPLRIDSDADGNWLASYELDPSEKKDIAVVVTVKVNFLPNANSIVPSDIYLQDNHIWNYNDPIFTVPEIQALTTPKAIYDFVVDKFNYDFNKVNKLSSQKISASESLKNPESSICSDFTNTFIAIARKIGVPARELQGFALSTNQDLKPLGIDQDVLHSWPEYFDSNKNTWIQIDPTWSKTTQGIDYYNKLDFNHIVFVIHGLDPYNPVTAGGYKNKDTQSKDVFVEPTEAVLFPEAQASLEQAKQINDSLVFEIINNSPLGFYGNIKTDKNEYITGTDIVVNLAPYSTGNVGIPLVKRPLINKVTVASIITVNGSRHEQFITIEPLLTPIIILPSIGGLLAAAAFIARGLYLRRRKR